VAPKEAVCFFVCLVYPPSPSVHSGKSRLSATAWLTVRWLVFVPQVEQFALELAVLASLDSFEFPVRHKADLQGSKFSLFVLELN